MITKKVAKIAVGLPVKGVFDYRIPAQLSLRVTPGKRVKIPFGRRLLTGFVVGLSKKSKIKDLRMIQEVLDEEPLFDSSLLKFATLLGRYYFSQTGEVLASALPSYYRKNRPRKKKP